MTREECERKIAEYCAAIRLTIQEYDPDFDYLSITFYKSTNGNDAGDWDCYNVNGNNAYWEKDEDHPINFHSFKNIKDDKYWACVTEEEDRECDEQSAYDGNLLPDGAFFYSEAISRYER